MVRNDSMYAKISMIYATTTMGDKDNTTASTTELDSHANMVVVGAQATTIRRSGRSAKVRDFSDNCKSSKAVPIIDAAVAYDCPYTMNTILLIVRNALYVPNMAHNLTPLFIMREAGLVVNDVPRIHCGDRVTRESHCIIDEGLNMQMPLALQGVFSTFPTRALSSEEQMHCGNLDFIMLTPDLDHWDPHDETYVQNDDSFLDFRGELVYPIPNKCKLINEQDYVDIDVSHDRFESAINAVVASNDVTFVTDTTPHDTDSTFNMDQDDPIQANVCDLSACLDEDLFTDILNKHLNDSEFAMSIGATAAGNPQEASNFDLFDSHISATHAERAKGVTKKYRARCGAFLRLRHIAHSK